MMKKQFLVYLLLVISLMAVFPVQAATAKKHHVVQSKKAHRVLVRHKSSIAKKKSQVSNKKSTKKQKKYYLAPRPVKRHYVANVQADNVPAVVVPPRSFVASIEDRLVGYVRSTVNTLRYSAYKLGGRKFDTSRGIYILDCSDYVDNILQAIYPSAYDNLVSSSGTEKPTSQHYYNFFSRLGQSSNHYWNRIDDVDALRPGDVLVFRTKNRYGNETGGHVMVVMNKPKSDENVFLVRVADSAPSGHSQDTRQAKASGIGIGDMLLKVNPETGAPAAYAWKVGARWQHNVNFAMARPVGTH